MKNWCKDTYFFQIRFFLSVFLRIFASMKCWLTILTLLMTLSGYAQTTSSGWELLWEQRYSREDMDEEEWEESLDRLQQLADNPICINTATRDELEQIPFLSEQQVMDIMEYLYHYRTMRSLNEIAMIPSIDHWQRQLLGYFITFEEPEKEPYRPRLDSLLSRGHHTVTATSRWPFYQRKGDKNGYLGYALRHSLRYEFKSGDYLRAGLIGAQDAGEPFFTNCNKLGYDTYSYYIQLRKLGFWENVVVGKYKLSAGMGLVLNNSFMLGKQFMLQNMGRQTNTLRPHSSRSESDYFQGAGATLRLSKPLSLTAFVSYRSMDATLNDDGSAATLITSGYHRTQTEIDKKYNTHLTATGAMLNLHYGGLRVGANAVYTHLDRSLEPDRTVLYRRYNAHGKDFMNASVNYTYYHYRFTVNGETAVNQDGAIATVNTLGYHPSDVFNAIALYRFYSYRYTGLYSHSFSDSGHTQNESGIYVGFNWTPLGSLTLQAYADYSHSPWARYQVSQTSDAGDFMVQADWSKGNWNVQGRYRIHLRQKDNDEKTALIPDREQRMRLFAAYTSPSGWSAKTQADLTRSHYKETSNGWMVSEHLSYQRPSWLVNLVAGYFDTDTYASRIFIYERQMQYDFSFPSYYGQGIRLSLVAQAALTSQLRLAAKLGYTNYFDRAIIGSGLQQIDASHQTDLDLQLRWKF